MSKFVGPGWQVRNIRRPIRTSYAGSPIYRNDITAARLPRGIRGVMNGCRNRRAGNWIPVIDLYPCRTRRPNQNANWSDVSSVDCYIELIRSTAGSNIGTSDRKKARIGINME